MSTELVRADLLAELEASGWISSTALVIDRPDLSFEKYEALGVLLGKVGTAVKFWIGDFLLFGEEAFGEIAAQASESLNLSEAGRQECLRVALAIPPARRRASLAWWHHRLVSAKWITPRQRDDLLDRAEAEGLTTRELEAIVRDLRALDSHSGGATGPCDELVEGAAKELRERLRSCGYGDVAVAIEIAAPGVTFRVEVGGGRGEA